MFLCASQTSRSFVAAQFNQEAGTARIRRESGAKHKAPDSYKYISPYYIQHRPHLLLTKNNSLQLQVLFTTPPPSSRVIFVVRRINKLLCSQFCYGLWGIYNLHSVFEGVSNYFCNATPRKVLTKAMAKGFIFMFKLYTKKKIVSTRKDLAVI